MKKIMKGQLMAVLMSLVMVVSLMPMRTFADDKQIVSEVDALEFEAPVVGETPDTDVVAPSDAAYSVRDESKFNANKTKYVTWRDITDGKDIYKSDIENGYTFFSGHKYEATVAFELKDLSNYEWDEQIKITAKMNGNTMIDAGGEFKINSIVVNKDMGVCFVTYLFESVKEGPGFEKHKIRINPTTNGTVTSNHDKAVAGAVIKLTVTPDEGYELDTIKANCVIDGHEEEIDMGEEYKFMMPNAEVVVTATFKKSVEKHYTVTIVNPIEHGKITVDKNSELSEGDLVNITVTPDEGYELETLIVKDEGTNLVTMETPTSFKMPAANVNVDATFKKMAVTKYTVKFESNGGSAVEDQSVNDGEKATKPANPTRETYEFEGWYTDEALSNPFDFDTAITKDITLYAKWKAKESNSYTVTIANPIEDGKVTVDKDSGLSEGDLVNIMIMPDEGYELETLIVKDEGTNLLAMETATSFRMPAANVNIDATFKRISVKYDIVSGADGKWFKDSGKDFEIVIKRNIADHKCFDYFVGVIIDDEVLIPGVDYDARAGSTIINIKAAFLQRLDVGKHTVMIIFDDREVEMELNINKAVPVVNNDKTQKVNKDKTEKANIVNANKKPNTADESNVAIWTVLMLMSIAGTVVAISYRLKLKNYR